MRTTAKPEITGVFGKTQPEQGTWNHFPRSEDWMHQPMIRKSFEVMLRDFLDESPLKPDKK